MSAATPASANFNEARPVPPVVPDYELVRIIGRGSYGEVWLARSALGTLRAVKVVYRDRFDSDRPYQREFAGIRQFEPVSSHESQVRVYHVGENTAAGYFYYVMELADNAAAATSTSNPASADAPADYQPVTLAVTLEQRGRLPGPEALPILRALASALAHLHGHGLVHRDIKPSNVIFVQGRPKLADIGLITSATSADTLVGTLGYIPPEGPGTPAADLYSFGKVLYEVVTGNDRQEFPNLPEDFTERPDRDQLLEFNELILKCCHVNPGERYPSAAELLGDLKRLEAGRSLRRDRARRRRLVWLLAGLTAAGAWLGLERAFLSPVPERAGAGEARRWTNSLGMVFVSIPGLAVDFSVWETRRGDFARFIEATGHEPGQALILFAGGGRAVRRWDEVGTDERADHPVRAVTWADATAFCEWLTRTERDVAGLPAGARYRLPTDREWSRVVGLTNETGATPHARHLEGTNSKVFYWGEGWPPPPGFGNFSGEESVMVRRIPGYHDGFRSAAPVGSFPPERFGLHDLAGNVSEICADLVAGPETMPPVYTVRGSAYESSAATAFHPSRRLSIGASEAQPAIGFRVVFERAESAAGNALHTPDSTVDGEGASGGPVARGAGIPFAHGRGMELGGGTDQ